MLHLRYTQISKRQISLKLTQHKNIQKLKRYATFSNNQSTFSTKQTKTHSSNPHTPNKNTQLTASRTEQMRAPVKRTND